MTDEEINDAAGKLIMQWQKLDHMSKDSWGWYTLHGGTTD